MLSNEDRGKIVWRKHSLRRENGFLVLAPCGALAPGRKRYQARSNKVLPRLILQEDITGQKYGLPKQTMRILILICITLSQFVKQVWLLPQSVMLSVKRKRGQAALSEAEAERLDRLRHPSKYLGK